MNIPFKTLQELLDTILKISNLKNNPEVYITDEDESFAICMKYDNTKLKFEDYVLIHNDDDDVINVDSIKDRLLEIDSKWNELKDISSK